MTPTTPGETQQQADHVERHAAAGVAVGREQPDGEDEPDEARAGR